VLRCSGVQWIDTSVHKEHRSIEEHGMDQIILYASEDGETRLQVNLKDETVWLTQDQMAILFQKAKSTINEHIKNIYLEGEVEEAETKQKFGNSEFQQKAPFYYNLDVIISVGHRVKSLQGNRFRKEQ
jgi:hypothetical protein